MIDFHLACVPPTVTHQHKRIVYIGRGRAARARLADRPELVEAKRFLDLLLMMHKIPAPITGPVALRLEFVWPWRVKEPQRERAKGRIPHTSRPDASNCAKTFEDRLVAMHFIEDDNAVVSLTVVKWWGPIGGIRVQIEAVDDQLLPR